VGRALGLLCSVLADLQYSELNMLVGLSFIFALEDHDFVVLRADSLLSCYLQHESDEFISVLQQVSGHLVPDDATACVNLPHRRRVDRTGENCGLGTLSSQELGEVSTLRYHDHERDLVVECQFHGLRREDLGDRGIRTELGRVQLRNGGCLLVVVDALCFYNSFGCLDRGSCRIRTDGSFMREYENVCTFEGRR